MLNSTYRSAQNLIFSHNPLVRRATLGLLLASGALLIALFIGIVGPLLALAAAIAVVGLALILDDTHWGFVALAGVIFVLPFATLPFSIGFKPTFLDVALGALFFVWVFKLVTGQQEDFIASPLGLLVGLFMLMMVFSFANGLTHSAANSFFIRRFMELLLGISLFFVAINTVRSKDEVIWVTRWLLLAGWAGASIAVIFYVIPEDATVWVLNRLQRFDYPGGYGALRYIEDDTAGTMRAIGTAVDPNVLGGMMIMVAAPLAPQLFSSERIFPRWLTASHVRHCLRRTLLDLQSVSAAGPGRGHRPAGVAQISTPDPMGHRRGHSAALSAPNPGVCGPSLRGLCRRGSGHPDAFRRVQGRA